MTKTYSQIIGQIKLLEKQAEAVRSKEVRNVIGRIKEAIDAYGLTAEDLGLSGKRPRQAGKPARPGKKATRRTAIAKRVAPEAKYQDDQGNSWSGRGRRPEWLRTAIESGRVLEEFSRDKAAA
jgi:DNA-binding protein H-NS